MTVFHTFLPFLIAAAILTEIYAQNAGNCNVEHITEGHWQSAYENDPINDDVELYKNFTASNPISVESAIGDYLQATVEFNEGTTSQFIVTTTADFENYEAENPSSSAEPYLVVIFSLTCDGTSRLTFRQPIVDVNNHYPEFDVDGYSATLPMPLVSNIDVTQFGLEISAKDIDITNTWIDFTINTDDLVVETEGPLDDLRKQFRAVVKTNKPIRYTENQLFELTATDNGSPPLSSTVTLEIKVDTENSFPEAPQFSQVYYMATYNDQQEIHSIVHDDILLVDGEEVSLRGEYSQYFEASLVENVVIVVLASGNLPDSILQSQHTLVLVLVATSTTTDVEGTSVLLITLPEQQCIPDTTFSPSTPDVCDCTTTNCPDCGECTTTTTSSDETTCVECPECTTTFTTDWPGDSTTSCPIEISTDCPTVTECSPATEAPVCPDFTTTEGPTHTDVEITFSESLYKFIVEPTQLGYIGIVKAESTDDEELKYTLFTPEDYINLEESTGVLTNTDYLSIGLHDLIVEAEGSKTGATNRANVIIAVGSVNVCEGEIETAYTVLIRHVVEEQTNPNIVDVQTENENGLKYQILEQHPAANSLFEINPETGSLESNAIDRESPLIHDMFLPQFTLKLRLVNASTETRVRRSALDFLSRIGYEYDGKVWAYLDQQVQRVSNEMVVVVIVDDINDNAPIFDPHDDVIGYPEKELASQIMPPYLTTVHATDPDEGFNASVYYLPTSDNVYVHPVTGVVYPTDELYEDDNQEVSIVATDRNGTGLSSNSLKFKVKLLGAEEICVLSIENVLLENLREQLSELSKSIGVEIKYLTASVVPKSDARKKDADQYRMQLIIYGFNADNDLLSADELKKLFNDLSETSEWSIESWSNNYDENKNIAVGYIVSISILSALLALLIAAVVIFYVTKLRKTENYDSTDEAFGNSPVEAIKTVDQLSAYSSQSSDFQGFIKNTKTPEPKLVNNDRPKRRLTGNVLLEENRIAQNMDEPEYIGDTEELYDVSVVESNFDTSTEIETNNKSSRERKKSVAFNDNVEKMEIEKETEISEPYMNDN